VQSTDTPHNLMGNDSSSINDMDTSNRNLRNDINKIFKYMTVMDANMKQKQSNQEELIGKLIIMQQSFNQSNTDINDPTSANSTTTTSNTTTTITESTEKHSSDCALLGKEL
jgi:hypothetical protein